MRICNLFTTEIDLLGNEVILICGSLVSNTTMPIMILCLLFEHPLTTRPPETILCKPIMISSCQQFLKYEIYKFKLTIHSAYKLFSQPWESHEVWLFHMVYSSLCHGLTNFSMPQTIYLKSELQSTKHLVSLDAYNFFHCCNNHWSIFRIIEFKYF